VVSWSADRHEMPPLHACSSLEKTRKPEELTTALKLIY
jgi:hypothetical protein